MERQSLRLVCKGWHGDDSPGLLVDMVPGVVKVEGFYSRLTGNRGAIVMSFRDEESKDEALEWAEDSKFAFVEAYSKRSNSNAWHRIQTWWGYS